MAVPIFHQDGDIWLCLQVTSRVKRNGNLQGFSIPESLVLQVIGHTLQTKLQQVQAILELKSI